MQQLGDARPHTAHTQAFVLTPTAWVKSAPSKGDQRAEDEDFPEALSFKRDGRSHRLSQCSKTHILSCFSFSSLKQGLRYARLAGNSLSGKGDFEHSNPPASTS